MMKSIYIKFVVVQLVLERNLPHPKSDPKIFCLFCNSVLADDQLLEDENLFVISSDRLLQTDSRLKILFICERFLLKIHKYNNFFYFIQSYIL